MTVVIIMLCLVFIVLFCIAVEIGSILQKFERVDKKDE